MIHEKHVPTNLELHWAKERGERSIRTNGLLSGLYLSASIVSFFGSNPSVFKIDLSGWPQYVMGSMFLLLAGYYWSGAQEAQNKQNKRLIEAVLADVNKQCDDVEFTAVTKENKNES